MASPLNVQVLTQKVTSGDEVVKATDCIRPTTELTTTKRNMSNK